MHSASGLPEVSSVDSRATALFPQEAETKVSNGEVWRRELGDRKDTRRGQQDLLGHSI